MAAYISEQTVDQVRLANDIIEIIGAVVPLKRAGSSFRGLCPFHQEKTPSFHVNPAKQAYHCFGCHQGGNVFSFVMQYEGLSFPEAVRRLAERAHIPIESISSPGEAFDRSEKDQLLNLHEGVTQRWHHLLLNDPAAQIARDYLIKRQVGAEAIQQFRLGYSLDTWDDIVNFAKSKKVPFPLLLKSGLVSQGDKSPDHAYDRFRGRLMFPICDDQGRVIGFSGRTLNPEEKAGKYVNSPETPLFHKSKVIFGLDKAKRSLLQSRFAVICEGQLDLIACHSAGVTNVVAPQGTALTSDHARILKRYVDEVVLCFDADSAGQKAMVRALDELVPYGFSVRVATIPSPHDPDSYIREMGVDTFRNLIQSAGNFFDFYLQYLSDNQDLTRDQGRLNFLKNLLDGLKKLNQPVLADTYLQKAALRLGVDVQTLRNEYRKRLREKTTPETTSSSPQEEELDSEAFPPSAPPIPQETWLFKLILQDDALLEIASHYLDLDWIDHPEIRHLLHHVLYQFQEQSWRGPAALLNDLESNQHKKWVSEALVEERDIPNRPTQVQDCILFLRNRHLDRLMAQLTRDLQNASSESISEILGKQAQIRLQKKSPLSPLV